MKMCEECGDANNILEYPDEIICRSCGTIYPIEAN